MLVVPNNNDLTLLLGTKTVTVDKADLSSHARAKSDAVCKTIYQMIVSPLETVYKDLEDDVKLAFVDAIKDSYHPNVRTGGLEAGEGVGAREDMLIEIAHMRDC